MNHCLVAQTFREPGHLVWLSVRSDFLAGQSCGLERAREIVRREYPSVGQAQYLARNGFCGGEGANQDV